VVVTTSSDGGATWTEPWDVTNEDLVIEPDLLIVTETQFPFVLPDVDNFMNVLYMQDFEPGLAVRGDEDPFSDNFMNFLALDAAQVRNSGVISDVKVVDAAEFDFEISPNPASGMALISYVVPEMAPTTISIYDMMGKEVKSYNRGEIMAGNYNNTISVADLSSGLYLVRLQTGDRIAVQKLQVQ
jgi:hypothetical protein